MRVHRRMGVRNDNRTERVDARLEGLAEAEWPQATIRIIATAHTEDDPVTVELPRALSQFRALAARHAPTHARIAAYERRHTGRIERALHEGRRRRVLHRLVEPRPEAAVLRTLISALGTEAALGLRSREDAEAPLRCHVRRLARNARIAAPPRR